MGRKPKSRDSDGAVSSRVVSFTMENELFDSFNTYREMLGIPLASVLTIACRMVQPAMDRLVRTVYSGTDMVRSVVAEATLATATQGDRSEIASAVQELGKRVEQKNQIVLNTLKEFQERDAKRQEIAKNLSPVEVANHIDSGIGDVLDNPRAVMMGSSEAIAVDVSEAISNDSTAHTSAPTATASKPESIDLVSAIDSTVPDAEELDFLSIISDKK